MQDSLVLDNMIERVPFTVCSLCSRSPRYHSPIGCFQCARQREGGPLAASQMHPVPLKNQEWPVHMATYLPK